MFGYWAQLTPKQKYAIIVAVVAIVLLIIVVSMKMKKKEALSYKTPERFAPVYQVPYVKERFSNDFAVPMVAKAQKTATRASPFVGSL
jgi:hypothetical protein